MVFIAIERRGPAVDGERAHELAAVLRAALYGGLQPLTRAVPPAHPGGAEAEYLDPRNCRSTCRRTS